MDGDVDVDEGGRGFVVGGDHGGDVGGGLLVGEGHNVRQQEPEAVV